MKQVLKAIVHGDGNLLNNYPELQEALVWVYFHSNIPEFNRVGCWGPLKDAGAPPSPVEHGHGTHESKQQATPASNWDLPEPCKEKCECCFPPMSLIHWSEQQLKANPKWLIHLYHPQKSVALVYIFITEIVCQMPLLAFSDWRVGMFNCLCFKMCFFFHIYWIFKKKKFNSRMSPELI